jgi:hypothetical protein
MRSGTVAHGTIRRRKVSPSRLRGPFGRRRLGRRGRRGRRLLAGLLTCQVGWTELAGAKG